MQNGKYRLGSLGVFLNSKNQVLVCQRTDCLNWQFPQGGQEANESAKECLIREMQEELGTSNFKILEEIPDPLYYDFPKDLPADIIKQYQGQCLNWFLCKFEKDQLPDLKNASSKEFIAYKWESSKWVLENIVSWKKKSYELGLKQLKLINL